MVKILVRSKILLICIPLLVGCDLYNPFLATVSKPSTSDVHDTILITPTPGGGIFGDIVNYNYPIATASPESTSLDRTSPTPTPTEIPVITSTPGTTETVVPVTMTPEPTITPTPTVVQTLTPTPTDTMEMFSAPSETIEPAVTPTLTATPISLTPTPTATPLATVTIDPPWYNASWGYRKKITIDHTQISEDLADYPFYLLIENDIDLKTHARPAGTSFVFTRDQSTALSYDLEHYDSTTGTLSAWIKIPDVSSTVDTIFYLYYGLGYDSNQEDAGNTWASSYKGVWHMDGSSAGEIKDSTFNYNHITSSLGSPLYNQPGKIGQAVFFEGTQSKLVVNDTSNSLDLSGEFTYSAWVKPTDLSATTVILNKGNNYWLGYVNQGPEKGFIVQTYDGVLIYYLYTNQKEMDNQWFFVTTTFNGAEMSIWVNGVKLNSHANSESWLVDDIPLYIGGNASTTYFPGYIDEVRISNTGFTDGHISTMSRNEMNPLSFYSLGSAETSP